VTFPTPSSISAKSSSTRGRTADETQRLAAHPGAIVQGQPGLSLNQCRLGLRPSEIAPAPFRTTSGPRGCSAPLVRQLLGPRPHSAQAATAPASDHRAVTSRRRARSNPCQGPRSRLDVLRTFRRVKTGNRRQGRSSLLCHLKSDGDERPVRNPTCRRRQKTRR